MSERLRDQARLGTFVTGGLRLDAILGRGGFGVVYRGTYPNGATVAVKVLHAVHALREEVLARFDREAEVVARLAGPGVPRVLDRNVTPDGCPFIVFELAPGVSLAQVLQEKRMLSYLQVRHVVEQVLEVLARAHARGVVHRDLKPSNLLYGPDGTVTVLDFGIAMDLVGRRLTAQDEAVGTFAYMPPEQAIGARAETGPASDVFSLGATAITLLAGKQVRRVVVGGPPSAFPSIYELGLDAPRAFLDVLARAVSFAPEDRHPDGAAMRAALVESEGTFVDEATEVGGAPPEVVQHRLLSMIEKERGARDRLANIIGEAPGSGAALGGRVAMAHRRAFDIGASESGPESSESRADAPSGRGCVSSLARPLDPASRCALLAPSFPWRAVIGLAFALLAGVCFVTLLRRH